jgi:hypothetical protein
MAPSHRFKLAIAERRSRVPHALLKQLPGACRHVYKQFSDLLDWEEKDLPITNG